MCSCHSPRHGLHQTDWSGGCSSYPARFGRHRLRVGLRGRGSGNHGIRRLGADRIELAIVRVDAAGANSESTRRW